MLLIDLDGFKEINDALGHHAGDQVLQEVATRLRGSLRASDTVARLGGDEFAVLLPATDVNRAELAARKVLHDLEHPFVADGRPLMVSASIGIAGVPWHAATAATSCCSKADSAMYLAKNDKTGYVGLQRRSAISASISASASPRRCGRRSTARQFVARLPADRAHPHRHACWRSNRWCAGTIPSSAGCCRTISFASPSTPAWSIR